MGIAVLRLEICGSIGQNKSSYDERQVQQFSNTSTCRKTCDEFPHGKIDVSFMLKSCKSEHRETISGFRGGPLEW
jgi:hypothetical protein